MTSFGSSVFGAFRRRPILFNGAIGGILCATSDAFAQRYEEISQEQRHRHQGGHTISSNSTNSYRDDDEDDHDNSDRPSRVTLLHHASTPTTIAPIMQDNPSTTMIPPSFSTTLSPSSFDWVRFATAGVIGVFFGGIVYPAAYAQLDAIFTTTAVVTATATSATAASTSAVTAISSTSLLPTFSSYSYQAFLTVVKKSVTEIATVGIFVNSVSMTSRGLCRRDKDPTQIFDHVRNELPTVTRNDCLVWLPYNLIAFSAIPTPIRPATTALMEATWQAYISYRSHDFVPTCEPLINDPAGGIVAGDIDG